MHKNTESTEPIQKLNLAQWIPATRTEGPGLRFALWFQGCSIRCPGCCNPEMLPFRKAHPLTVDYTLELIEDAVERFGIEGITCLGGEPFDQPDGLAELLEKVRSKGLSSVVFTGYTLEALRENPTPSVRRALRNIDVLIDGPFVRELSTESRRWIGSENQRLHFLSPRYAGDPSFWRGSNQIEIFFDGKEVWICGFPFRKFWNKIVRSNSRFQ